MITTTIGQLRHRITLEQDVHTKDKYQGDVSTFLPRATVNAQVSPLSGKELLVAEQQQSLTTHRIKMRYFRGITSAWRVDFEGRKLNIVSVIDIDERKIEHHLMCSERQ